MSLWNKRIIHFFEKLKLSIPGKCFFVATKTTSYSDDHTSLGIVDVRIGKNYRHKLPSLPTGNSILRKLLSERALVN